MSIPSRNPGLRGLSPGVGGGETVGADGEFLVASSPMSDGGEEAFDFDPRRVRVVPGVFGRTPLLPVAAAVIGGIAAHEHVAARPVAFAGLAAGFALLGFAWQSRAATACVLLAAALAGLAAAQRAHYRFPADHVAHLTTDDRRLAELEVELLEDPRWLAVPDAGRPRPPRAVAAAEVTAAREVAGWRPASGAIYLRLDDPDPALAAGDVVRALGWLQRPGPAENPGQFDYANYYRGRRVLAGFTVDDPALAAVVGRAGPGVPARVRSGAARLLTGGFAADDAEHAALLRAMLLGDGDPAMSDARDLFRRSGTSHYLAVSGLHVGVVGGLAAVLARLLGGGPKTCVVAGGLTVLGYATLAAPSPPVLRATILAGSYGLGLLLNRRGGGLQLLSAAAVALLLVAPLDLYRAGFQLSFVTVLGLILLGDAARRRLGGRGEGGVRGQLDPGLVRAGRWADHRLLSGLAAAAVAWLAAMPLVALHFGSFNAWAVPASLAAAPLVVASLVGGVLKLGLTFLLPPLAGVWAELAAVPVRGMLGVVAGFASLPGAESPLPAPPAWLVLGFYASLALAWNAPRPAAAAWAARLPLAACSLLIFVLPLAGYRASASASGELRVTLLAVGRGQCAVIEPPGGGVTLLDAGSTSLGRPLEQCVAPFLRHRGVARVERVVLSHANLDHYNAADGVAAGYAVGEVAVGPQFAGDARGEAAGRRLLGELARLDLPPRVVAAGDAVPLGGRTTLRVLWPPAGAAVGGDAVSGNDASLVLRLEHAGRRVLFCGDVQADATDALLDLHAASGGDLLRADVLVAPHHGSAERNTADLLDAVDPTWTLSSNGSALSAKHRRFADLMAGRRFLRTSDAGAITLRLDDGGDVGVETFLGGGRATLTYPE